MEKWTNQMPKSTLHCKTEEENDEQRALTKSESTKLETFRKGEFVLFYHGILVTVPFKRGKGKIREFWPLHLRSVERFDMKESLHFSHLYIKPISKSWQLYVLNIF